MSDKIKMKTPLVEIDGDEMTRVLWKMIKEELLSPYIELQTEYYDLGLKTRDETDDQITVEAAEAIKKYKVGVKCATITPNVDRIKEYDLKKAWKSPNGTIRAILDGTVFRCPITVSNIKPSIRSWKKPVIVARHAYGDIYKDTEYRVPGPGKAELLFTPEKGEEFRRTICEFEEGGVLLGMYNLDSSIKNFARACFQFALEEDIDVWFATKDTISKKYDHTFKELFQEVYDREFAKEFEARGREYFYTLIDDAIARVVRSEGGFMWAMKNYDGDVMSDMVASVYGSLAMMTSVLVSPKGYYEYEAAHGTVQRHYYRHLKGEKTSTNSMALIFAWTGALKKRGEIDRIPELIDFADKLEDASLEVIENGIMTKDLARLAEPPAQKVVNSEEFLQEVRQKLKEKRES